MIYATVAIIVEGALSEEHICKTVEEVQQRADQACAAGMIDGLRTEVWVLSHNHEPFPEDDCSCALYLSDHAPFRVYDPEEV